MTVQGRGSSLPQTRNEDPNPHRTHSRFHKRILHVEQQQQQQQDARSQPQPQPQQHLPAQFGAPQNHRRQQTPTSNEADDATKTITEIVETVSVVQVVDEVGSTIESYTVRVPQSTATGEGEVSGFNGLPPPPPAFSSKGTGEGNWTNTATTKSASATTSETTIEASSSTALSLSLLPSSSPSPFPSDDANEDEDDEDTNDDENDQTTPIIATPIETAMEPSTPTIKTVFPSSSPFFFIPPNSSETSTVAGDAPLSDTPLPLPLSSVESSPSDAAFAPTSSPSPEPETELSGAINASSLSSLLEQATSSTALEALTLTESTSESPSSTTTVPSSETSSETSLSSSTTFSTSSSSSSSSTSFSTLVTPTTTIAAGGFGGGEEPAVAGGGNSNPATDSAEASASDSNDDGPKTGAVVGGVFGGIAGVAIVALLALFLLRRYKRLHSLPLASGSSGEIGPAGTRGMLTAGPSGGSREKAVSMANTERSSLPFFIPASLATMGARRVSSGASASDGSQKGFEKVAGRRLPSVLTHGGDGYSTPPERQSMFSGGSFYRNSDGFYGGTGSAGANNTLGVVGTPIRPESGIVVMRDGPARTPVTEANPFLDPQPNPNPFVDPVPGTPPPADSYSHNNSLSPPRPLRDSVGRSLTSQDGSRISRGSGSRFTEEIY